MMNVRVPYPIVRSVIILGFRGVRVYIMLRVSLCGLVMEV